MSQLIDHLKKDHTQLRDLMVQLKNERQDFDDLKIIFKQLAAAVNAHAHAEEDVVYKFMNETGDLASLAMEGVEEHKLIDFLIVKLCSPQKDERWLSRTKVLMELLEHHLDEEEKEAFPKLKNKLDSSTDFQLARDYSQLINEEKSIGYTWPTNRRDPSSVAS